MPKCINYRGWKVWLFENQWIRLFVAPQLGGRLIQLEMNGYEFFFVNSLLAGKEPDSTRLGENGTWLNYGGEKIWPAPQGWNSPDEWPGPPDPVLDSGEYSLEFGENNNELKMTSPFDGYTGLQIFKEVSISEKINEINITGSFRNGSNVVRSWSVWPVLQLNAAGDVSGRYQIVCPPAKKSRFTGGYKIMHGLVNNPQYKTDENGNICVSYQYLVGKIGLDTDSNWAAFVDANTGKVFTLMFRVQKNQVYPEDTSFQIWTSGRGMIYSRNTIRQHPDDQVQNPPYMEMELLSQLKKINPEEQERFEYRILTTTIPEKKSVKSVTSFGVIAASLQIDITNDRALLRASYGVFSEGVLKICLKGILGKEPPIYLFETKVTPLEGIEIEFSIDKKYLLGKEIFIASELYDSDGQVVGEIENIRIKDYSYEYQKV